MDKFNKNKKIVISLVIVLLTTIVVGGIIFYKKSQVKSLGSITYGYNMWPGVLPYLVAYDKGFFKENGLDVNLVEVSTYTEEIDNFLSGKVDFLGDFALIDVIKNVSKGEKIKVILATDYSNGADGIVAKSGINLIQDLKGKKVAVEKETLGEYLLYDALKKNNLSLDDIVEVNLSAQESASAFIRGEVEAAVSYEPDLSRSLSKGGGSKIYTSVDSPGLIIDTLVFRPDFITANPLKVSAVVLAYFKAVDYISNNKDESYLIGSKYFGITPMELEEQYSGIKQVSFTENTSLVSFGDNNSSLHGLIKKAHEFLKEKGVTTGSVDSTEIVDAKFIRSLIN
jgi:NitT/TauT family transport system substrate-binding protein